MPTLIVQLPGLPPVSHIVREETTTIGRMKTNSIVIDDSSVSLMHAKITRKNGEFYLKDLNSTNGTLVNGQQVTEALLKDQDRVRFADVTTQYLGEPGVEALESGAAVSPAAAPIPVQVLGLVASLDTAKTAPAVRPTHPLQEAAVHIPTGGTTLIRVRERPKSRSSARVGAGIGILATLTAVGLIGWRFSHLSPSLEQAANATPASRPVSAGTGQGPTGNPDSIPSFSTGPLSPPSAIPDNSPELAILLKSQDIALRRQAARALHALGPEAVKAAAGLHEVVADQDEEVRMWAALALVNSHEYDKRTVPILVHVLKNEDPVLRQVACLSLGVVPSEDREKELVVAALAETAGKDANEDVRNAAKSALNIIAPELYGKGP